ncbi:MAG: hypothetical protein P857_1089 [Candidatus Xenolissoclinum pacificiensis L6]|uniref:Uncharacterized protein n=1 Tax=Candidatus Xenolissoclinum pacificiensis L6 TaxID=1401685 RepID=W2V0X0_9RICK|nr:MAG: hypothetical protein P857_1089 [Candidatus Xenolissoclinum pacificiensis L6]
MKQITYGKWWIEDYICSEERFDEIILLRIVKSDVWKGHSPKISHILCNIRGGVFLSADV